MSPVSRLLPNLGGSPAGGLETSLTECRLRHRSDLSDSFHCRLEKVLRRFAEAKAALQRSEYDAKAREVEAVVGGWKQCACKRQAACEWLLQELHQQAAERGASQLGALKAQAQLFHSPPVLPGRHRSAGPHSKASAASVSCCPVAGERKAVSGPSV